MQSEEYNQRQICFVIFSDLEGWRFGPRETFLKWLIMAMQFGEKIVHVDFAVNDTVLCSTYGGNRYLPLSKYMVHWPGIRAVFRIDTPTPPNLGYFQYGVGVPKKVWPSVARRFLNGGLLWTEDCLCNALMCLTAAGVPVPADTPTPIALLRWLKGNGYARRTRRHGSTARCPLPDSSAE